MKKARKILTLILVFVLLAGVFSGCAMFGRNSTKYRSLVAVTVGGEEITVGKILDTYNNYYNNYGSQGVASEYLLQATMQTLVSQAMKVSAYKASNPAATDNTDLKDFCVNAQYLTKEEMEYAIRYVKYITYQTFDSSVISQLSNDRTFGEEEKEDTSRDFTEPVDLEGNEYSMYSYRQSVFGKEAGEYFDKYYKGVTISLDTNVDEYIYNDATVAAARLKNLNDRLEEDDEKITFEEYKSAQERVVKQFQRSIKTTYSLELAEFMKNQVADIVTSTIANKYNYNISKVIDTDNLNDTLNTLKSNLEILTAAQATGFSLNDSFVEFIQELKSSSYILNVPDDYEYIFVKNILIPFTEQQQAILTNVSNDMGGDTKNETYLNLRNKYAAEIIADDFNSEKNEDGEYAKVNNLFKMENGKLVVNPEGELGNVFLADGSVNKGEFATADEAVIANMKRFNTDTAQHTAQYDYVVRVGDIPADYTHAWVTEFVDAAHEAYEMGEGTYSLAVSTYGVHIVYYSAKVTAQTFDFEQNRLNTTMPEYRMFSAYFEEQSKILVAEAAEALNKDFLDNNKIVINKAFDRFLKDNGFKFDLIDFLTPDEED